MPTLFHQFHFRGKSAWRFYHLAPALLSKTHVATGSMGGDGAGRNAGHVSIFQYNNDTDTWQQLGQKIDGEAALDLFGYSVSLSVDGNIVAAGGFFNDGRGPDDSSHVRIFQFNGTLWVELGQEVDWEAAFDLFGSSSGTFCRWIHCGCWGGIQ